MGWWYTGNNERGKALSQGLKNRGKLTKAFARCKRRSGIIQHLLAYGCETKYDEHINSHVGLSKFLVNKDAQEMAELFRRLDEFRAGRWYGGQGNGEIVKACLKFIQEVKKWSKLSD